MKIQTEKKEFEAGPMKGTASSLGGGQAAGIWGRAGADIDSLGFVYAVDVVEYHLENVKYDLGQLDKNKAKLTPTVAVRATYVNRDDQPKGFVFNESATASQSNNWSMSFGVKLGAKVTGETSFLGLVGGSSSCRRRSRGASALASPSPAPTKSPSPPTARSRASRR